MSRTLTALTQDQAEQIVQALEQLEKPILDREVMLALASQGELVLDGDLTARPVSDTSTSYPDAAYGHMGMKSARAGLSGSPGLPENPDVWAAVALQQLTPGRYGVHGSDRRPGACRRGCGRTATFAAHRSPDPAAGSPGQTAPGTGGPFRRKPAGRAACFGSNGRDGPADPSASGAVSPTGSRVPGGRSKARPFSRLGKLRTQLGVLQRRRSRLEKRLPKLDRKRKLRQEKWAESLQVEQQLRQRLEQFEQENAANAFPIRAIFRLDAGFSNRENLAWLIEMGYEVYSRPYGNWLLPCLKQQAGDQPWQPVGNNAEMIVWKHMQPKDFPYPLDLALERFHTGEKLKHNVLLHFGSDPVTDDPAGWFTFYNARQTIEAGIKEGKGTFAMRYLKVRSKPALYLQEQFGRFAANFVRFAAEWVAQQCRSVPRVGKTRPSPKSSSR